MTVPYIFKTAVGTIPLAQLDDNFAAVVDTTSLASATGATSVGFTPTGTIVATTVQTALSELDTEKASTTALALKTNITDLAASTGASLVGTIQGVTGSVQRTVAAKLKDCVSVRDFGAIGNGQADESAAVQLAIDYAESQYLGIYFPSGRYKFNTTVNFTRAWKILGDAGQTQISTTNNIPIFRFNPVGQGAIYTWSVEGLHFQGPSVNDVNSCAMLFDGDGNVTAYGKVRATSNGFYSVVKVVNDSVGGTGSIFWSDFNMIIQNVYKYGYWFTKGSGTGNTFHGQITMLNADSAAYRFEGAGYTVGDLIIEGHIGCLVPNAVGVSIGDNTVYRSRINLSRMQFDANCDIPLQLSSVGTILFSNVNMTSNNYGGAVKMGASLQPLVSSIITDIDASDWLCGKNVSNPTIGAINITCFDIETRTYGAVSVRVNVNGLVGGLGSCAAEMQFKIVGNGLGGVNITPIEKYITQANGFSFYTSSAGLITTVGITYTSSSIATLFNATLNATGTQFKVTVL